jgi:hypothetical protein
MDIIIINPKFTKELLYEPSQECSSQIKAREMLKGNRTSLSNLSFYQRRICKLFKDN